MLLYETRGEKYFHYYYDSNGTLYAVNYKLGPNDTSVRAYYFTHNWRGDIVGIYNGNGELRARYEYDSWGNVISITDQNGNAITDKNHIANLNPFRYRSYYMDTETGMYYLMSRYYDPVTHRFLNADGYFQTGLGILDANMNAYCKNNPIMNCDPDGNNPLIALGLLAFFKVAIAVTAVTIGISIVTNPTFINGVKSAAKSASDSFSRSNDKATTYAKESTKKSNLNGPKIYRYGGTNPGNLTPKQKDANSGLSFSIIPPKPGQSAAVTTIDELNKTSVVFAYQDSLTYVSVRPLPHIDTMQDWIDTGSGHICTQTIKAVVVKWDGGN